MAPFCRIGRLVCAAALAFASSLAPFVFGQMPSGNPNQIMNGVGIAPKLGTKLPRELQFVDADRNQVRLGDLFSDRPVLLHLVYYECPMLCKLSSDGLLRSLETLSLKPGEDFSIVTVSFNPGEGPELSAKARDMARERLAMTNMGVWQFLTGKEPEIVALCDAVGFHYTYDKKTEQYAHASGVFVLTSDGQVSRFLTGIEYSPRDLRLAIVEASKGRVGSAADQVLLMCYMYDPTRGKYGFAIMSALRLAGIATVAAMASGIILMIRRERRARLNTKSELEVR